MARSGLAQTECAGLKPMSSCPAYVRAVGRKGRGGEALDRRRRQRSAHFHRVGLIDHRVAHREMIA